MFFIVQIYQLLNFRNDTKLFVKAGIMSSNAQKRKLINPKPIYSMDIVHNSECEMNECIEKRDNCRQIQNKNTD